MIPLTPHHTYINRHDNICMSQLLGTSIFTGIIVSSAVLISTISITPPTIILVNSIAFIAAITGLTSSVSIHNCLNEQE